MPLRISLGIFQNIFNEVSLIIVAQNLSLYRQEFIQGFVREFPLGAPPRIRPPFIKDSSAKSFCGISTEVYSKESSWKFIENMFKVSSLNASEYSFKDAFPLKLLMKSSMNSFAEFSKYVRYISISLSEVDARVSSDILAIVHLKDSVNILQKIARNSSGKYSRNSSKDSVKKRLWKFFLGILQTFWGFSKHSVRNSSDESFEMQQNKRNSSKKFSEDSSKLYENTLQKSIQKASINILEKLLQEFFQKFLQFLWKFAFFDVCSRKPPKNSPETLPRILRRFTRESLFGRSSKDFSTNSIKDSSAKGSSSNSTEGYSKEFSWKFTE